MPGVWFPNAAALGSFMNVDHTFTADEGQLPQTCCPPGLWNSNTTTCEGLFEYGSGDGAALGCPPDGTRYVAGDFNVTWAHEVATASYGSTPMAAVASGTVYSGLLKYTDGSSAYTEEPMTHTQHGCLAINKQTFWFFKRCGGR